MDDWKHLRVGDIVKVYNKQRIPSDLILLATSHKKGDCFIETKNLDGETNLKSRMANATLGRIFEDIENKINPDSMYFFLTLINDSAPFSSSTRGRTLLCTSLKAVS